MLLRLVVQDHDGYAVIRAVGELDTSTAPNVTDTVRAAVAERYAGVVIDLSGVTFIDSTGISALVAATQAAEQAETYLALVAPDEQAVRVMHLLGLEGTLHLHDTIEGAVHRD